jgi:hypothetical protein
MKRKGSTFWFLVGVFFITWIVMVGFQKISPHLMPGTRVEYDSGQGWKEMQLIPRSAGVRELLVKRVGSDFPSMAWTIRQPMRTPNKDDSAIQTETYTLPAGASFNGFVIQRSPAEDVLLLSVITRRGATIPVFSDGVRLGDGVYSISTKDEVFQSNLFKIENGELYFVGN